MALRRRAALLTLPLLAAAVAQGPATAAPAAPATRPAAANQALTAATTGFRTADIVADDGAVLKANVIEPTTAGSHPAIVFINS